NKRKLLAPLAGAGASAVVAKGLAYGGVLGAVSGPALGVGAGAALVAGLLALGVMHGRTVYSYRAAPAKLSAEYEGDGSGVNSDTIIATIGGGELSALVKSLEKAHKARGDFLDWSKFNHHSRNVGVTATCYQAAEYAHKLLYWGKRMDR